MNFTVTCPQCHMENAYFDMYQYRCPDCDYEWPLDNNAKETNFNFDEEAITAEYEELKVKKMPYFKLKHGKIYSCKIEHTEGIEDLTIMPLAFEPDRNLQFIMGDAERLFKENPRIVQQIISMNFLTIWNDGLALFPFDYSALTNVWVTKKNNTLMDFSGSILFEFAITDII